jgi:hypothetical protein
VTFQIGGEIAFISLMPAPYPWEDLEGPCATSWLWRESKNELSNHKKHMIISWMTRIDDPVVKSLVLSQLTASVLEATNGIGVYWGNSALVNKKDVFCSMVYDIHEDGIPLFLWIDYRIEQHSSGELNLITYGLDKFKVMELEVIKSRKSFNELIDFATGISQYLIANGNVIKDGDTIGEDENQKIMAWHKQSLWTEDDRGLVLRVDF